MAMDFAKEGPVYGIAQDRDANVINDAMALRLLGGLHRLVLDGTVPVLARHYPSAGGTPSPSLAVDVIQTIASHMDFLKGYLALPPQTNEVGRSNALLDGFLTIAEETWYPLRLLEIGSSAGLNLFWDRFNYINDGFEWPEQPGGVTLLTEWSGPALSVSNRPDVVERAGCDIAPVDIHSDDACRRLESYVWSDQPERLERLRGAIEIARHTPYRLDKADTGDWLSRELTRPRDGVCSVIFHSIMWQYMPQETQDKTREQILKAGERAASSAPVAWLRLEFNQPAELKTFPVLKLTTWPGGTERILATAHFHGAWVKWGDQVPGSWT